MKLSLLNWCDSLYMEIKWCMRVGNSGKEDMVFVMIFVMIVVKNVVGFWRNWWCFVFFRLGLCVLW